MRALKPHIHKSHIQQENSKKVFCNMYIFLHQTKTGGSTVTYHIEKNFSDYEKLHLTLENMKLSPKNINQYTHKDYLSAADRYLQSLSKPRKDNINILYGHFIPYGIHKHFSQKSNYITVFRNPTDRVVSIYNHKRKNYDHRINASNIKSSFLINNHAPDFSTWVETKLKQNELDIKTTYGFLFRLGYLGENTTNNELINDLNKFSFIGISNKPSHDVLYIYKLLNIHKFFINQNISKKYYKPENKLKLENRLKKIISHDFKIFKIAKQLNLNSRKSENYKKTVLVKKIEKKILIIFTQSIFASKDTIKKFYK